MSYYEDAKNTYAALEALRPCGWQIVVRFIKRVFAKKRRNIEEPREPAEPVIVRLTGLKPEVAAAIRKEWVAQTKND